MMEHPWMQKELSNTQPSVPMKNKLEKYMSIRKEKSYKKKAEQANNGDDDEMFD
jgi:hypothetical protein